MFANIFPGLYVVFLLNGFLEADFWFEAVPSVYLAFVD